jgi:hypothetical protein
MAKEISEKTESNSTQIGKQLTVDKCKRNFEPTEVLKIITGFHNQSFDQTLGIRKS